MHACFSAMQCRLIPDLEKNYNYALLTHFTTCMYAYPGFLFNNSLSNMYIYITPCSWDNALSLNTALARCVMTWPCIHAAVCIRSTLLTLILSITSTAAHAQLYCACAGDEGSWREHPAGRAAGQLIGWACCHKREERRVKQRMLCSAHTRRL